MFNIKNVKKEVKSYAVILTINFNGVTFEEVVSLRGHSAVKARVGEALKDLELKYNNYIIASDLDIVEIYEED